MSAFVVTKRGLDERLVHVLAAAPGDERVEAGRRARCSPAWKR